MNDLSKLIKKAQNGDKDAYAEIYTLFYKRIFRYCKFNFAKDPADICQETFFRAYKSINQFSEKRGGSFQAYLFRIARNLIIDEKRKKPTVPLESYQGFESDENLTEEVDKREEKKRLHAVLATLSEKERQIIILRYFEEMTTTEAAKVLGMREGALRVRSHRILQKLKERLEKNV